MPRTWTASLQLLVVVAFALATSAHTHAAQDADSPQPNAEAAKAFEEVVKHYRKLPSVEVDCTMQIEMEQDGQKAAGDKVETRIIHSANGDGVLTLNGFTCTIKGDTLWMEHESTDHSYYSEKFEDSPYYPLFMKFMDLPFPHIGIFWGEPEMSDLWMQLVTRTPNLVPMLLEEVKADDGHAQQVITFSSEDASMTMRINAESKLIESIEHEIHDGQFVRDGAIIRSTYAIENIVHDNPADAPKIAFDPAGRQRVDFIQSLVARPVREIPDQPIQVPGQAGGEPGDAFVGKPAPPIVVPLLGGGDFDLAAMKGQVVVIDFWAVWCPPCRAALPNLHEVANWAKRQDLPVRFFAINVWEKGADDAARNKVAGDFWKDNKYTLPVGMDHAGGVAQAYALQGIPTTIIVRSDGVVHGYHIGAPPNYVEWLQGEIKDAIAALEGGGGDDHGHAH